MNPTAYHAPVEYSQCRNEERRRGRPRFHVSREQLEYLAALSFSWTEIASVLGVSRMTVFRRRREFHMVNTGEPITISDLVTLLREMRMEFPDMGQTIVLGRLRSQGFSVTRDRVRQGIRRTDPINTALRGLAGAISRRHYSVPGPNSLWHIGKCCLSTSVWTVVVMSV